MAKEPRVVALVRWRKERYSAAKDFAAKIGVNPKTYAAYEAGIRPVPDYIWPKIRRHGFDEGTENVNGVVGVPEITVPYIGFIPQEGAVDWIDPTATGQTALVPGHMLRGVANPFLGQTSSDLMMPMIEPGDWLVFERTNLPKRERVALFRFNDGALMLGVVAHRDGVYYIEPLNPRYEGRPAEGTFLGYLTGIHRTGDEVFNRHRPDGLRP